MSNTAREARLAQALRANLRRRKQQPKAKVPAGSAAAETAGTDHAAEALADPVGDALRGRAAGPI